MHLLHAAFRSSQFAVSRGGMDQLKPLVRIGCVVQLSGNGPRQSKADLVLPGQ